MTLVYGPYTQHELDRQYDQGTLTRDISHRAEVWMGRSKRLRARCPGTVNLPYGTHPSEKVDIFPTRGSSSRPSVVVFHGGAWRSLSKDHFSFIAEGLMTVGMSAAIPGFSLAPNVSLDVQIHQARAAFAWVWKNAAALALDADQLFVAGHSSGAHLAAILATTKWEPWGLPSLAVKGVLAISGIYDLEPVRLSSRNSYLDLTVQAARRSSPLLAISSARENPCRLIVAWGEYELDEFRRQGAHFAATAIASGWPCEPVEMSGHDHFSIVEEFAAPDGALLARLLAR